MLKGVLCSRSAWRGLAETLEHAYGTNFGEVEQPSNDAVARFDMAVKRPASFFLWKLTLTLGSLLSAIFLQKSYSDTLPDLGYLVFMDKIYLLAYPLILLVLIRSIMAYVSARSLSEAEGVLMQQVDRKVMYVLGIAFVVGTGLITLTR